MAEQPDSPLGQDAPILVTPSGRRFVRTPDACFAGVPGYDWPVHHVVVDGLRMAFVVAGPPDGEVVLCLHGQPTWGFLYRRMIPTMATAGLRVVVPDLIGFGRSDKPVGLEDYTYLQHVAWLHEFIEKLGLDDITAIVQDWGAVIGLRCAGDRPERFARLVVANGQLPVVPEGSAPVPLPSDPDVTRDLPYPFGPDADPAIPSFVRWVHYALTGADFRPSAVMEDASLVHLDDAELAAYDAPYPDRTHMAGVRAFPSLVNTLGEPPTNASARASLDEFVRPVLGLFGLQDGIIDSDHARDQIRARIRGAVGQPHRDYPDAGHYIQEDVGVRLAQDIVDWICATPIHPNSTRGTTQ